MTSRRERDQAQQRRTRIARRRLAALPLLALVAVVAVALTSGTSVDRTAGPRPVVRPARPAKSPAVEAGLLPYRLPAPISREVVVPAGAGRLDILGGLSGNTSADGVYALDVSSGTLRAIGSLAAGVHDAAGTVVGGREIVLGGGSPATVATVQAFGGGGKGSMIGALPVARSDSVAVTVGATTFIAGGYDGASADRPVLSTTNGQSFRSVGTLAVPVRYPALAALAGKLYVFGGDAVSGPSAGRPVDDIQAVDLSTRKTRVVGHLPEPLAAAVAVTLGGSIYLAGGESTAPQASAPGAGSTQLQPAPPAGPSAGLFPVPTIWAFDAVRDRALVAGRLQVPVSHAAVAVLGARAWVVGGESGGGQLATVQMFTPNRAFGVAGEAGAGSPYFGDKLLIADRGNNRLLVLDAAMHVEWTFPSRSSPHDPYGFFFPDDAFFIDHGRAILSNQEENETIQEVGYPSGKVLWVYGHRGQAGSAPGYLHEPDDAYLLKDGRITVADAQNCRVLVINPNRTIAHQIGTTGACIHNPPVAMAADNGDTPLPDGNLLISEVTGSWVDEYTPSGRLVWARRLPVSYPSDPQQLGPDLYLIADYSTPGQIVEFNRAGSISYRYDVAGGPGMLNQPSLTELLPSGVFMANDDFRHRMVAIDPATRALVWQYGITDRPGSGYGMLRIPDGFDILAPDGSTPTHAATG